MKSMHIGLNSLDKFYLGEEAALQKLNDFNEFVHKKGKNFLGYPCNGVLKLKKFIKWWERSYLSKTPLNDAGNPSCDNFYTLNAHAFECTVIDYFAELFSIKPHWGYVTSGGTQGNEQGLYMGRSILSEFGKPILYFSEESHYSIASLGRVLGLECCVIQSQSNGEMDYEDFGQKLNPDRPVLLSLSIGTTFKGAIDRIERIMPIIKKKKIKHVFYHADAALFGGYLPFYPDARKPNLNFSKFPYDSIAVSGHKFFGSPIPMGIFLIRYKHVKAMDVEYIEYISTPNITIPCSRSSLNSLIFWWIISTMPKEEFVHEVSAMLDTAQYLYYQLKKRKYSVWLNPYSNTVFFKRPSLEITKRWSLSLYTCPKLGPLAHVMVMQHVTKNLINDFLKDLDSR